MSAGVITSGRRATTMPGCVPGGNRNAFEKSRSPDTTIDEVSLARAAIASSGGTTKAGVTHVDDRVASRSERPRHGTGQ